MKTNSGFKTISIIKIRQVRKNLGCVRLSIVNSILNKYHSRQIWQKKWPDLILLRLLRENLFFDSKISKMQSSYAFTVTPNFNMHLYLSLMTKSLHCHQAIIRNLVPGHLFGYQSSQKIASEQFSDLKLMSPILNPVFNGLLFQNEMQRLIFISEKSRKSNFKSLQNLAKIFSDFLNMDLPIFRAESKKILNKYTVVWQKLAKSLFLYLSWWNEKQVLVKNLPSYSKYIQLTAFESKSNFDSVIVSSDDIEPGIFKIATTWNDLRNIFSQKRDLVSRFYVNLFQNQIQSRELYNFSFPVTTSNELVKIGQKSIFTIKKFVGMDRHQILNYRNLTYNFLQSLARYFQTEAWLQDQEIEPSEKMRFKQNGVELATLDEHQRQSSRHITFQSLDYAHPFKFAPEMELARMKMPDIVERPNLKTDQNEIKTTNVAAAIPEVDINRLTDRVYQELERKIRIERERRGL